MAERARLGVRRAAALLGSALVGALLIGVLFAPSPPLRAHPKRIEVRFWHMWTAEWKVVVDRIVERFNQSQDEYEVVALSVPASSADSKFLLAVVGGDPPDVMTQWNPVIPTWAESGMLTPLDELMSKEEWSTFERTAYPVAKKIGTYRGKLYGLAVGVNLWAAYYRIDALQEAGLDPERFPTSLEGLVAWGEKLDRFDAQGNLTRLGFLPSWLGLYAPLFGGGFYDWQKGQLTLDTDANRRALSFLVERRSRLGLDKVTRFDSAQNAGSGIEWPFMTGAYAIAADGQWRVEQLARYAPELRYGVTPIPPPQGGKEHAGWSSGNFMIVPRGAKQARGAWQFMKYWSGLENPERAAEFYTWGGWLPSFPAVAAAPAFQTYLQKYPQFRCFVELMPSENWETAAPVPYQVYLADREAAADQLASRGVLTPAAALAALEQQAREELVRRRRLGFAD